MNCKIVIRITGLALALLASGTMLLACEPSAPEETAPPTTHEPGEVEEKSPPEPATAEVVVKTLDDLPEGLNIVQHEMRLLTTAMQNILVHIANDQLAAIPPEISKVHPVYELTHQALKEGIYTPPFNSVPDFVAQDEAFHTDLVALVRASRKNDLQTATTVYGKLVDGCTSCHTQFRFAPNVEP